MAQRANDRLIVALDGFSSVEDALRFVDDLDGIVSFFKIGLELFVAGYWLDLARELGERDKRIFLDLKLPGDIGATISSTLRRISEHPIVEFLTLSTGVPRQTFAAAKEGRGARSNPKLLAVPYLSSLDATDVADLAGGATDLDDFIVHRSRVAIDAGCDGLIASGDAIGLLRRAFPRAILVSPGIRPSGSSLDDHKRSTTPADAVRSGADYLVVGRPVRMQKTREDRRAMAKSIVEEIGGAI